MKKALKIKSMMMATMLACSFSFGACESAMGLLEKELPVYTVSVSSTEGGTLTASANEVYEGETVVFTISLEEGYLLEALIVNGSEVEVVGNTFTIESALRDFEVHAKFSTPNVTLEFETGVEGTHVENQERLYGGEFGKLPVPIRKGYRFLGWQIEGKGDYVGEFTDVEEYGVIKLVADWGLLTESEKENLEPFSSSCVYHDAAATKYGVVWHTYAVPAASVIQIVEGTSDDFSSARTIQADSEAWLTEYISSVVIDGLKFSTDYSVRFGDISADVWSDTYHFTTREEIIEEFSFAYVLDTQETYLVETHPASSYIGDTYFSYVIKDMVERFDDVEFIVHGGDIVNYGAEELHWKQYFQSMKENLFQYPQQVVAGNHEDENWYSAGHATVAKLFNYDLPEGQNLKAGAFYSYDYGPVHFVNILTNDAFNNNGHIGPAQLKWIREDMTKARANPNTKWIIAVMHEGIFTPSATPTALASNYHNKELSEDLCPIFDEFNVEFVMYGHHHLYLNTYPLVCDETQTEVINKVSGVSPVTTETRWVEYDGVQIAEFVYPEGTTDKGTVHFEMGPTGHQYTSSSWGWLSLANLEANIAQYKRFRMMLSGGARPDDGVAEGGSMYAYVEVSDNEIVVRTYVVDCKAQAQNVSLDNTYYLDGFRLTK